MGGAGFGLLRLVAFLPPAGREENRRLNRVDRWAIKTFGLYRDIGKHWGWWPVPIAKVALILGATCFACYAAIRGFSMGGLGILWSLLEVSLTLLGVCWVVSFTKGYSFLVRGVVENQEEANNKEDSQSRQDDTNQPRVLG